MQLLRYALVGMVATVTHYALLILAVEAGGWPAWPASGAGALLGAQVAYLGNRVLTFAHDGAVMASWWRFQLTALAAALLGMATVALLVAYAWHYLLAQAVATVLVMLASYAVNRHWAFAPAPPG